MALFALLLVWTFCRVRLKKSRIEGYLLRAQPNMEEIANGLLDLGFVVLSRFCLGYGHYYKGPSGVIDSGIAGVIWERLTCWGAEIFWPAF